MQTIDTIYTFETKNFRIIVDALDEPDPDLSFDDTGEVREKLESGEYIAFCARARVIEKNTGTELASDYLGDCIYESPAAFMNHRGIKEYSRKISEKEGREIVCGSYFSDMVRNVCAEARKAHAQMREKFCAVTLHG